MTRVKQTEAVIIQAGKKTITPATYHEVGIFEAEELIKKVRNGGNEKELREELIRKSKW